MISAVFIQNLLIAIKSVRTQLLRTILTALIIAIGITALVGILTAIDSLKASITSEFTSMGANTFVIQQLRSRVRHENKSLKYRKIEFSEATRFKQLFENNALISVSCRSSFGSTVKFKNAKTNPNVSVLGIDENYLPTAGYSIAFGRSLNKNDEGVNVALIGKEIADKLFGEGSPLGEFVKVDGTRYEVVGVLKEKGASSGFGGDRTVLIPITKARVRYPSSDGSFAINVLVKNANQLNQIIDESRGAFRKIRKVDLLKPDDFEIRRSDSIATKFIENMQVVTLVAGLVGFITLLGAAIGLMNIMLVSVTERTREIGVRKALGAKVDTIRNQFLIEAVLICQIGGALGIVFGVLVGNGVAFLTGGSFIVPWVWIGLGFTICFVVGVISGYYPARKASRLDPVEALRYE